MEPHIAHTSCFKLIVDSRENRANAVRAFSEYDSRPAGVTRSPAGKITNGGAIAIGGDHRAPVSLLSSEAMVGYQLGRLALPRLQFSIHHRVLSGLRKMPMEKQSSSFWTSLPAVLTAAATLIAAVTGTVALYINTRPEPTAPAANTSRATETERSESSDRDRGPFEAGGPKPPIPGGNRPFPPPRP